MKDYKIKKLMQIDKITQIGGMVATTFNQLRNETNTLNETIFALSRALGLSLNGAELMEVAKKGALTISYLIGLYKQKEFDKRRASATEETTDTQIRLAIARDFSRIYKEFDKTTTKGIANTNYPLITKYFLSALVFDNESGYIISGDAFLTIYKQLSRARETDAHRRQEIAVNAVNAFFSGVPVTKEEINRYFTIENGRFAINPKAETDNLYLRLS